MNDKELNEEEVGRPSVKSIVNRFENPQLHTGNARQTASKASTLASTLYHPPSGSFQPKEKQQFKNVQLHESKRSPRSKPQSRENQESQKFKSKREAIDHGTPYEEMMVVWQILSLLGDQRVANFKISSNHPHFRSFDDMVVKIEYKNGQTAYNAYQLKHSDNENKTIKKESLRSLKGDFSIGKYYEQNHKMNEKFIFILHTNRPFELINHTFNVQYDTDKTIDVRVVEKEDKSYIFEVLGGNQNVSEDEASFRSFFKRFRLDANQGGFKQLEARCLQEFSKLFGAKKEDFIVFKEFVHKWYLEKGKKVFLQKKFIITKIVECLLTPNLTYISYDGVDNKTKHLVLLKEAISKANVTIFRSRHVWDKVKWTNSSSIDDINKSGFENFLIVKKCKSMNDLTEEAYTKISWYQGQCPLLINVTEINLEIVKVSLELLSKNGIIDKKILLTCEATIEKYDNMIFFSNLHDLKTIDEEIYQNIVENFDCTFQGKETKLSDFVDDDSAKIFTTDCLLRSAEGKLIIGGNKETVPENLMERKLQRIIIEPGITNKTTNDLIVVSYNDMEQNEQVIFAKGSKNKHLLKYLDGSLEWIKSVGNTEILRSYRNESPVYLDDELSCLKNSQHNINIISAATGLGKSTMLKYFKNEYKAGFWVFFIDTKQQTKYLQQNGLDVKTFVFSLFPMETLEKELLEILYNKRKLVFLWDALDEIPNKTQRELTLSFIENVQQLGFLQWISSRQHLQHELEEKFNTFGRNIQIFDEQQRDHYIKKRLSPKYIDEEIIVLTKKIKQNMVRLEAHAILGMPLQLFLLTELVLEHAGKTEDLLLRPITLTKLYESLIEGKLNHYFSKSKNESELVKSQFKARYLDKYQTTGFQLICLEANVLRLEFNPYEKKLLDEVHGESSDPVGLLSKSGKTMSFLHHTYAEYFAALYISENHKRIKGLEKVFSDNLFKNVKYMLDSILSKEFEAHTAVLYNDLNALRNLGGKIYDVDKNGRSPLHIALSWTSQSFALPKLDPSKNSQLVRNWNNLEIAIFLIEQYVTRGKESLLSDRDEILKQNCFDYANGCLPLLAILTKKIRVIEFILKEETRLFCNQNEDTFLMFAAFTSNEDIIEYLVKNQEVDLNMSNVNGNTVLHFLLEREGSYKLVKLLVDRGADVNKKDELGYRPIHYAATYGDLEVAKFIIERIDDINCRSQSNWTPLMIASSRGNLKMVELLIDKGADAEVKNDKGETATEIANKMRRYDIGQLLQATGKKNNILLASSCINLALHTEIKDFEISAYGERLTNFDKIKVRLEYNDDKIVNTSLAEFKLKDHQEDAEKLLEETVKKYTNGREDSFVKFVEFIDNWRIRQGEKKLNKKMIVVKFIESLLTPFIQNVIRTEFTDGFTRSLEEAIRRFNITTLRKSDQFINKIWVNAKSEEEINKAAFDYYLTKEKQEEIEYSNHIKASWHLQQYPLIAKVDQKSKDILSSVMELLASNDITDRSLILLNVDDDFKIPSKLSHFQNLSDLRKLNEKIFRDILQSEVYVQGRRCNLGQIVNCTEIETIFTTDCLMQIAEGEKEEESSNRYLPRSLSRIIMSLDLLRSFGDNEVVVITSKSDQNTLKARLRFAIYVELHELIRGSCQNYGELTVCICDDCTSEEFSSICKHFSERNCYRFKFDDNLEWIDSRGGAEKLKKYRIFLPSYETELSIFRESNEINIFCGDPGSGKTAMLKFLKKSFDVKWYPFYLDSKGCESIISDQQNIKEFFLSSAPNGEEFPDLIAFMYEEKRIVVLWDSIDEVPEKRKDIVYKFIEKIKKNGFPQWISSRPNIRTELENAFNTFSRDIVLNENEQERYILESRFSKSSTEKLIENVKILKTQSTIGIPKQLSVFTKLISQESEILPLSAAKLCDHIISEKFESWWMKSLEKESKTQIRDRMYKSYQLLGVKTCSREINVNFLDKSELAEEFSDPLCLIIKSANKDFLVRDVYCEYFAALFISQHYRRIPNFQQVYFNEKFRNVRLFLDFILCENSPAHTAILSKDVESLERNKEHILDVDLGGKTAVHLAFQWCREDLILNLESRTVDLKSLQIIRIVLDYCRGRNWTAFNKVDLLHMDCFSYAQGYMLQLSILCEDLEFVKFINENSGLTKWENREECTPLMYAAFAGNLGIAQYLISKENVNSKDVNGNTPLHYSLCGRTNLPLLQLLLENGADVTAANFQGITALQLPAVKNCTDEVSDLLIKYTTSTDASQNVNVEIDKVDEVDLPKFVHATVRKNQMEVKENEWTPLMCAAQRGCFQIAKSLVANRAEVNSVKSDGETALHVAARSSQIEVAMLLIQNDAEVNCCTEDGSTPLMLAAQKGCLEIAKCLIANKADVNSAKSNGFTALHIAVINNQIKIVEFLIEHNAQVNCTSKSGWTPLMWAAVKRCLEIAKCLIHNKAQVDSINIGGETTLHLAAYYNQTEIAKLLIKHHAQVNYKSKRGWTPLMRAAEKGCLEVAKCFIANEAEVNMSDDSGNTALHFAVEAKNLQMVQLLVENDSNVNAENRWLQRPLNLSSTKQIEDYLRFKSATR